MDIALACDHGAFSHKEALRKHLEEKGYTIHDFGCYSQDSVDYPDTVYPACEYVAQHPNSLGIVMCGTGIGASIVANKVNGIRCALVYDEEIAKITREHNNSNVLASGGRVVSEEKMIRIADVWLSTAFSEDARHQRRIDKITQVEGEQNER
jgi:ribose 5-phosphate isomerase B